MEYKTDIAIENYFNGIQMEIHEILKVLSQSVIANVKVTSVDPYSARYSAEEILESIFAMSLLYRPTKRPKIKQKLALVTLPDGSKLSVEPDTSRLTYIRNVKNAKENIAAFSDFHSRLDKHDTGQLSASLQYHKLSFAASADEARLVNLWIALESLIQYGGKHIIERICKYVPTSLATSYVYSILKNFTIDIRELWRNSDTGNLRADSIDDGIQPRSGTGGFLLYPVFRYSLAAKKLKNKTTSYPYGRCMLNLISWNLKRIIAVLQI